MYLIINNTEANKIFLGLAEKDKIIKTQIHKIVFYEGEKMLFLIDKFLKINKIRPKNLKGIIINTGPGPFTSLRISIMMANTWSYVQKIPIFGLKAKDFSNINKVLDKIKTIKAVEYIEPNYGVAPNITKAKKKVC